MKTATFRNKNGELFVVEIDPETGTGTIGGDEYGEHKIAISRDDMMGPTMLSTEEVQKIATIWSQAIDMPLGEVLQAMTRQSVQKAMAISKDMERRRKSAE